MALERYAKGGVREFSTENNLCEVGVKRSLVPFLSEFIYD